MKNMRELDLYEMEQVSGGRSYGTEGRLPSKKGCMVYCVREGDTILNLIRIYRLDKDRFMKENPGLRINDTLIPGSYIYIPAP